MRLVSTVRRRVRRLVVTGDPRVGLLVGFAITLLVAIAFARSGAFTPARRLENMALDLAFRFREPIRESDRILMVDLDDATYRNLRIPLDRKYYAQVVTALDHLGAREIIFDVQFKAQRPRPEEFDPDTGDYILDESNRILRAALLRSGKVTLPYHMNLEDDLSPAIRRQLPSLRPVFSRNIGATSEEVAEVTGVPVGVVRARLETIREEVVNSVVAELLAKTPDMSFADLRAKFLPAFDPDVHMAELKVLQFAYWLERSRRVLEAKSRRPRVEGDLPEHRRAFSIEPPYYPFLEAAHRVACVNADADQDGVLRRPWTHILFEGRPYPYMGLEAAMEALSEGKGAAVPVLRGDSLTVTLEGEESPSVVFPLEADGRVLVNWAGNANRQRGKEEDYYDHLPFNQFATFYQERYENLDDTVRKTIAQASDSGPQPYHQEYLTLSDRFRKVLSGEEALPGGGSRSLEARMDEIRRQIIADFDNDIQAIEQALPRIKSKRVREATEKHVQALKAQKDGIERAYERERLLRTRVEGKICFIGSASTAGGDLHATPISFKTPGVDALANVTNMVLTGQTIRRVPAAVDFLYLLVVGIAVSLAVTRWATVWAALFTLGLVGGSVALFAGLFAGPAVLVVGAGPPAVAILSFAGVIAYKELLTQRSKKKLQRELERNTSPELVNILLENPELLAKPRKMVGTFYFSDIKGFTSMSEKMSADVLVPFVNRYLDRTTAALKNHLAYLDKYIGDGIMALFGVPVPSPDHARNACRAALENQALLKGLNARFALEGLPQIRTRIGIHSGEAISGYVGADNRSDYTVVGDAVNLAARLEGANKEYDTSILISQATLDLVGDQFVVRELDRVRVIGRRNAVRIFELIGAKGDAIPFEPGFLEAYGEAFRAFNERRWQPALEGFEKALALKPGDKPSMMHYTRCRSFLIQPPPPDWEGIFELASK